MSDYEDDEQLPDYSQLTNKKNKKGQTLKRGVKTNEHDQLVKARQALFECLSQEQTIPKNTSVGQLENNVVSIKQAKGTHLHTMGFSRQGVITLHLEEAAFLVARQALVVYDVHQNPVEFELLCELMCDESDHWISYDKYQVYAYLKRLGFIVMRSKATSFNPTQDIKNPYTPIHLTFFNSIVNYFHGPPLRKPLVWDYSCKDFCSVYSTLRIIPSSPWYKPFYNSLCRSFDWDVYKPGSTWKKKDPGLPDFKVIVNSVHDPMPSVHQQNQLFSQLSNQSNKPYPHSSKDTQLGELSPTFLLALVGDAEGVTFLKLVGDGLCDISNQAFESQKRTKSKKQNTPLKA